MPEPSTMRAGLLAKLDGLIEDGRNLRASFIERTVYRRPWIIPAGTPELVSDTTYTVDRAWLAKWYTNCHVVIGHIMTASPDSCEIMGCFDIPRADPQHLEYCLGVIESLRENLAWVMSDDQPHCGSSVWPCHGSAHPAARAASNHKPQAATTDRCGVGILMQVVAELGWILREQTTADYGIDAHIEIIEEEQATGRLIAVQLKSGSHCFTEPARGGYVFRGDLAHLHYWREHCLPVIVVLCDINTRTCYWQHIADSTAQVLERGWKTVVPKRQVLSPVSLPALESLCDAKEDEIAARVMDARYADEVVDMEYELSREDSAL